MEWTAVVTALVALYGAVLSTYTFIVNRRDKQRQIRVRLSNGLLTYAAETSPAMLFLEAMNPGNRTVVLNSAGIELPGGKTAVFPNSESDVSYPHPLEEGQKCTVWTPMKEFAQTLQSNGFSGKISLTAFFRDQVGNKYRSNALNFDIEEWANSVSG